MIRTQIQLTEAQHRELRRLAAEEGLSMAEIVRRALDLALSRSAPERRDLYRRASELVGAFPDRDGADDVARQHDAYLEEAFGDDGE
jgi:hypothetical protein